MNSPKAHEINFIPRRKFFIGFDSDGCVFDSMEIKHRECFIPALIWKWDLQAVSKYARECHEFVNLYSTWRGINRYPALVRTLELLAARIESRDRGYIPRDISPLKTWIANEKHLGNSTLAAAVAQSHDPLLALTLEWSELVNARITEMVYGVPPFPLVRESLLRARADCDILVVSQTPAAALRREWEEHNINSFAQCICGQEMGSKEQHLAATCVGKYAHDHTLMIGDAPGDLKAARSADALFFPIIPNHEVESWQRFSSEGYSHFMKGQFRGAYQNALLAEFEKALPSKAPWEKL